MKAHLEHLFAQALARLQDEGVLPAELPPLRLERPKDPGHGDFATNIALVLAKAARRPPRDIAQAVVQALPPSEAVARVEVAGPGFINVFLSEAAYHQVVRAILEEGEAYGRSQAGRGERVCLEFVSANPTGPLHVGHGRGAAYGATLGNILEAAGFAVHREYYVNDAGRQMDILAVSIWLRYLELCGEEVPFPEGGYQGDYVFDIAADLHREVGEALRRPAAEVFQGIAGDREMVLDALIARARMLLGHEAYRRVFDLGLQVILKDIRDTLALFGVTYDTWFSEQGLIERGEVAGAIERLREGGFTYEKDGALWFAASRFGDEKDRVLVRENGQFTYFATDIAYHLNKRARGFARLLDVWGADHHGYVPRLKAALQALGEDGQSLEVLLVQFAILYRGKARVQMSTRSGEFITLRALIREVGRDAARFFYVMRRHDQHLDFDLELAKSQSADNPVYYIQYAHARVASVMEKLKARGLAWDEAQGLAHLALLKEDHERALLRTLSRYGEVVEACALAREPHQLAHYLRELATDFHTYYNAHTFLVEEAPLRNARLALVQATGQVIRNGLALLGVSAPERM